MAIGYSTSNSTNYPAIKYAGRLADDAVNTVTQTEATLIAGAGAQSGNCGGSACTRWGDYSAMALDPDGCTFWYTNEYYVATGLNDDTRIGSFKFSSCALTATTLTYTGATNATTGAAITLLATLSGHPRIDVDGFVLLVQI